MFWEEIWTKIKTGVVNQYVDGFIQGAPKLVSALVVFLIGRYIAKFASKLISRLLGMVGIDHFAERINDIDIVQNSGVRVKLSEIIAQMVYLMLMLIIIIAVTDVLSIEVISQLMRDLFNYLPSLFTAGIIVIIGLFVSDMIKGVVQSALHSMGVPSAKMMANVVFYLLFVSVAVSALAQAKINTQFLATNLSIIVGAGALAFAIGYGRASRDLIANYIAGFYNKNKVRIGDEIRISGTQGKVVMIDSSSIILQTDDRAIVIPLSMLTKEKVEVFYPDSRDDEKRIESGEKAD